MGSRTVSWLCCTPRSVPVGLHPTSCPALPLPAALLPNPAVKPAPSLVLEPMCTPLPPVGLHTEPPLPYFMLPRISLLYGLGCSRQWEVGCRNASSPKRRERVRGLPFAPGMWSVCVCVCVCVKKHLVEPPSLSGPHLLKFPLANTPRELRKGSKDNHPSGLLDKLTFRLGENGHSWVLV